MKNTFISTFEKKTKKIYLDLVRNANNKHNLMVKYWFGTSIKFESDLSFPDRVDYHCNRTYYPCLKKT